MPCFCLGPLAQSCFLELNTIALESTLCDDLLTVLSSLPDGLAWRLRLKMSQIELSLYPQPPIHSLSCLSKSDLLPESVSGQIPGSQPPLLSLTPHNPIHQQSVKSKVALPPWEEPDHFSPCHTPSPGPVHCRFPPGLWQEPPRGTPRVHSLHTARWALWPLPH